MASAKVSIIIPCYKQAHLLPRAIESALGQSYENVEVVVVDDGSPDNTHAVAASYGSRVICLRKGNAGLSAARNTGILHCTGEFLLFLDADDYLPPTLLEEHLRTAEASPHGDVFYVTYFYVDLEGKRFGPRFDARVPKEPLHAFLLGNHFPPHAGLTRRTALANAGLFDVRLRSLEDWDMWIRLAASGAKFIRTENPAVPYSYYPGSMSKNFEVMRQAGLTVLRKNGGHHGRCRGCRRAIANGRWGVRSAFWNHTKAGLAAEHWSGASLWRATMALTRAVADDPLLAGVGIRKALRRLKWRILSPRGSTPEPSATAPSTPTGPIHADSG